MSNLTVQLKDSFDKGNIEVQGGENTSYKMLDSHKTSITQSPHSIANVNTGNSTYSHVN